MQYVAGTKFCPRNRDGDATQGKVLLPHVPTSRPCNMSPSVCRRLVPDFGCFSDGLGSITPGLSDNQYISISRISVGKLKQNRLNLKIRYYKESEPSGMLYDLTLIFSAPCNGVRKE